MFVKLSNTQQFTIKKYIGRKYKKWDDVAKTMLSSDVYKDGFSLRYGFETEQGTLELSKSQVGDLCATILNQEGIAKLIDKSFTVKAVKTGDEPKDVRYYFNLLKEEDHSQANPEMFEIPAF